MNDNVYRPCECGSGKKYKFCCYQKDREERRSRACGLCGKTEKLTKTECCGRWICDDEENYQLFSYRTNSCYRNHRRYTLCGSHHAEGHEGRWQDCAKCREGIETEKYVRYGTNRYNFEKLPNPPAFKPTHCSQCGQVIRIGEDAYTERGNEYLCETCGATILSEIIQDRIKKKELEDKFTNSGGFTRRQARFETGWVERTWVAWLGREWDRANYGYRLNLSRPGIVIGTSKSRHGHWDPVTRTITISKKTIREYPWHVVVSVLKHEMAHQYVSECSTSDASAHGPLFQTICLQMGLPEWAASATSDIPLAIPDWRKSSLTREEERLLEKTNKLLALAQSSNEHEAALAMQRVRELYTKYNLDQVEKRKEANFVSWILNFKSKRIEAWQSVILVILDRHFFVRTISFSEFDPVDLVEYKAAEIIGKRENVLMAEYVYRFLERTVHTLWEKHLDKNHALDRVPHQRLRSEKRHFIIGVLDGFLDQLDKMKVHQTVNRSEGECTSLIKLADNELNDFFRRKYPRVSKRNSGGFNPDRETYKTGVKEGQSIRLNRPMTSRQDYCGNLLTT